MKLKKQVLQTTNKEIILQKFGAEFYMPGDQAITSSRPNDLYNFTAYIGKHTYDLNRGDSAYTYNKNSVSVKKGSADITSDTLSIVLRGYNSPEKTSEIGSVTTLPFINGCSTRQIFPAERIGDPTLQLLYVPPYSSEQAHHMHSTARVAHIIEGTGTCVIGIDGYSYAQKLVPGMTLIIHPMCPHHFETQETGLLATPLHVFSAAPGAAEFNHPMFNGSHTI